jgi:hypothetical protein
MRFRVSVFHSLALIGLTACAGCGMNVKEQASLIPAKGKITYKGQPLTKGTVLFEPDGYGREARGEIKSDGTFVLGTNALDDGVVAGHHRISISGTGSHPARELVPKKYTSLNTSKLEADIDADHTEVNLDLSDAR